MRVSDGCIMVSCSLDLFYFYFRLQLLKATIVGVVILHLLLVPGTAFTTGGARILQQDLHPHANELNHSLLTLG